MTDCKKYIEIFNILVYNRFKLSKEEIIMADFLKTIEAVLVDLWNYLHVFLQYILEGKTEGENDLVVPPLDM